MQLYLNVFLISISLTIDAEHLLMYLLAMYMSLKKCIFKSSAYLKLKKIFFAIEFYQFFIYFGY